MCYAETERETHDQLHRSKKGMAGERLRPSARAADLRSAQRYGRSAGHTLRQYSQTLHQAHLSRQLQFAAETGRATLAAKERRRSGDVYLMTMCSMTVFWARVQARNRRKLLCSQVKLQVLRRSRSNAVTKKDAGPRPNRLLFVLIHCRMRADVLHDSEIMQCSSYCR